MITDDFNRGSLGANWETVLGTAWTTVGSVTAQPGAAYADGAMRRTEAAFPDNQYSQCKTELAVGGDGNASGSVAVRMDASGNCYYVQLGLSDITLYKRVAGTRTYISEATWSSSADTLYTLKIEIIGTAITCYVLGVGAPSPLINVTDADLTTGKPGLFSHTSDVRPDFDDFESTDASGGSSTPLTASLSDDINA